MRKKDKILVNNKLKKSTEIIEARKKFVKNHYTAGHQDNFIVFKKGKGSRIWDADGNEYIDYAMGLGPLIMGHSHPAIVDAVKETISDGAVHSYGEEKELRMAELMVEAIPGADSIAFANSGTEATLHALKLARAYTGKHKIAKFEGCYHGAHEFAQLSGRNTIAGPIEKPLTKPDFNGIPPYIIDNVIMLSLNREESFDILREHKDELAAVIVEPLPLICPIDLSEYLKKLQKVANECGIVFILDEVVTGFRIGYSGYQGTFGLTPDLTTYGKSIGGGLPVGAIAGKEEIMKFLDFSDFERPQDKISIIGTFSGNRVTMAAGVATLEYLKNNKHVYDDMEKRAAYIRSEFEAYGDKIGFPLQTLGMGSVFVPYFNKNEIKYTRDANWPTNMNVVDGLRKLLIKHDVALGDIGMFFLCTEHSREDCEITVDKLKKCLDDLY